MTVETDPGKAEVFESQEDVILASETRPGSDSLSTNSHELGLLVNLIEEFVFDLTDTEGKIHFFNVIRQDCIELKIKGQLWEVFLNFFFAMTLVGEDCLRIQVIDLQVITCVSYDFDSCSLSDIEGLVDKRVFLNWMNQ